MYVRTYVRLYDCMQCVDVCVRMYVCGHIYIYIYTYKCVCIIICMYAGNLCKYMCLHACMHICICLYACMNICMYIRGPFVSHSYQFMLMEAEILTEKWRFNSLSAGPGSQAAWFGTVMKGRGRGLFQGTCSQCVVNVSQTKIIRGQNG
jgi:hypothetical protein